VSTLLLPYHQDEHLGAGSIVLPDGLPVSVVDPQAADGDQWQRLASLYEALATHVAASVRAGEPTTVLTGDCLAVLGTLAGAQRAGLDPSLVWFDAHGDVHTLASSTSGYLGGMALRMALGGDADVLATELGLTPVPEGRVVLVDARDLDPAEIDYLARSAVMRSRVDQVDAADLADGPVLLHIDLDVIDASELPGLRFPAADGPTADTVLAAVGRLLDSGRVAVLDVACPWFEPTDDEQARRRTGLLDSIARLRG
jgi:arginase